MDRLETAEWQQVERFLDMLVASAQSGQNAESLAVACAQKLTHIRQREELRIQALRQLQQDWGPDGLVMQHLQQELADYKSEALVPERQELNALRQERDELKDSLRQRNHNNEATASERRELDALRLERDELKKLLAHRDEERAAADRLAASEHERDGARLELLQAELSLQKSKVKDYSEQLEAVKGQLAVSEAGREEALASASSIHQELAKARQERDESIAQQERFEKERKVFEAAARKAASELVSLRLQMQSGAKANVLAGISKSNDLIHTGPLYIKDEIANTARTDSSVSTDVADVISSTTSSIQDKGSPVMGDIDVATMSGSTPNSISPAPGSAKSDTPRSDSPSESSTPSPLLTPKEPYVPPDQSHVDAVMRAALDLAAVARQKADKALQRRQEERAAAQAAQSSPAMQTRQAEEVAPPPFHGAESCSPSLPGRGGHSPSLPRRGEDARPQAISAPERYYSMPVSGQQACPYPAAIVTCVGTPRDASPTRHATPSRARAGPLSMSMSQDALRPFHTTQPMHFRSPQQQLRQPLAWHH